MMPEPSSPPPHNPFAPPVVTSALPPGDEGFEGPGPTRVLWPVYLVTLLCWSAVNLWTTWFIRQVTRDDLLGYYFAAASLSGLVAGVLLAVLIGDRRAAKAVVMASLALLAAGVVASMPGIEGLALKAIGMVGRLGTAFVGLIMLAYCLRAASVRGVYITMIFLNGAVVLSAAGSTLGNTLLQGGRLALFTAAALAVSALVCAVFLVHPQRCTRADTATAVSVPRILLVVALLGAFRMLQAHMSLFARINARALELRGGLSLLEHLPRGLWWIVPLSAYFTRWRPLPLVLAGIWLAAAGGVGMALLDGGAPLLAARLASGLGFHALFDVASAVLLRQVLPLDSAARWLAIQSMVTRGLQFGFNALGAVGDGTLYSSRPLLLAISAVMAALGLALLLAIRRAPLRPIS
jgi:hypothetical protein